MTWPGGDRCITLGPVDLALRSGPCARGPAHGQGTRGLPTSILGLALYGYPTPCPTDRPAVRNADLMPSNEAAHLHSHDLDADVGVSTAKILRWTTIACAVLVVVGAIVLWPDRSGGGGDPLLLSADPVGAHVTEVTESQCTTDPSLVCRTVTFTVNGGDHAGTVGTFELFNSGDFSAGDDIRVIPSTRPDGQVDFAFFDYQRSTPMMILVAVFVAAVVVLGRWRGVGAVTGLAISLVVIVWFALPSLTDGNSAVAVALVSAGAIAIVALYLAHGASASTDVALLSTFASLALTGLLAWISVAATNLTGFTDSASFTLQDLGSDINPRGILLAGIVIGSLGVLDDVTVTQVSAVGELHRARPHATRRELFTSALRIGRDHISSTVNTLFLAYAGATLPLLLMFSEINESVTSVATREVVATEIVRAIVGSIGLVASVPISTWLAIQVVGDDQGDEAESASIVQRSQGSDPARSWRDDDGLRWQDDD